MAGELAARHGLGRGRPCDLEAVVRAVRPTVLVGVSGQGGLFTEPVIRALAGGTDRPIVLSMSNPTSKAEARPADVLQWSDGRALVATGSPFEPVDFGGRHVRIGQSNNAFVFPGLGLGVLVSGARVVTDGMFAAAAQRLAGEVTDEDLRAGSLFPAQSRIRAVQAAVAEAVVWQAQEEGQGEPFAEQPSRSRCGRRCGTRATRRFCRSRSRSPFSRRPPVIEAELRKLCRAAAGAPREVGGAFL